MILLALSPSLLLTILTKMNNLPAAKPNQSLVPDDSHLPANILHFLLMIAHLKKCFSITNEHQASQAEEIIKSLTSLNRRPTIGEVRSFCARIDQLFI